MYSGKGFQYSELGDVDVFYHKGKFHLFHLVLPNHDYIAHAESTDGILWKRVKNAIYIGEPGEWDDDMIWTMHISPDPDNGSLWRMFYTGISRKEGGRIQRIGLAKSPDLYNWEKTESTEYPLSIKGPVYEETFTDGRDWISCRDPFFYNENNERLLLVSARVAQGPIIRRGCIGLAREISTDHFEWQQQLFFPRMYDDIEVPGLYKINGRFYLFGNIKEDLKVHFWHSDSLFGEYEANADNVLLPKGNYAARITRKNDKYLLWNFYTTENEENQTRILPPPVELSADEHGRIKLASYSGFDSKIKERLDAENLLPFSTVFKNPTAQAAEDGTKIVLSSRTGYEVFYLDRTVYSARISAGISMKGRGKTGIILRGDDEANACYISLDLINGIAQSRVWRQREKADIEHMFEYRTIQRGHFRINGRLEYRVCILCFGGYFELIINGELVLRFVETSIMEEGKWGFYVESAEIHIDDLAMELLDAPEEEDHAVI